MATLAADSLTQAGAGQRRTKREGDVSVRAPDVHGVLEAFGIWLHREQRPPAVMELGDFVLRGLTELAAAKKPSPVMVRALAEYVAQFEAAQRLQLF